MPHAFFSYADFFQNIFFIKNFWSTNRVSNSLDPDPVWFYVFGADRGQNCLNRLSAEITRGLLVKS